MKKRLINLMLVFGMLLGQMSGIITAAAESKETDQTGTEEEAVYIPADSSIPEDFENDLWISSNFEVLEDSKINKINAAIKALEQVEKEPVDTTEIEAWAQTKMETIENHYKDISPQRDEWMIASLAKKGYVASNETLDTLKENIIDEETGQLKIEKNVDALTKSILALRASGIDVTNYYGYHLPETLAKLNISNRDLWSQAPAIWALNSDDYGAEVSTKVEEEIIKILDQQTETGVWNHWGWEDSTGFVLYALAPFYGVRDDVTQAVDRAINDLSTRQNEQGEFSANNGNSHSMVMGGLLSVNPDLLSDSRFIKNGNTMLDGLKAYEIEDGPYFSFKKGSESMKEMATEQAFRGLVTYFETQSENGHVFDYRGTEKRVLSESVNTAEIEAWAQAKMELIEDHYKDVNPQKDWWMIADLAKRGHTISDETFDFLKDQTIDKETGKLSNDVAVLSKSILALRAAGIDVTSYYGYNLPLELSKLDVRVWGIWTQGPAVWALNSDDYGAEIQEKVNEEINSLLEQQREDGTWGDQWGWEDSTGFALYALAPSYEAREDVRTAVDQAVDGISLQQNDEGGFSDNSNSLSMVVGGLLSNHPAYLSDARLVKNGKTMLHGLKEYDVEGEPLFNWKQGSTAQQGIATEQGFRALVTYFEMQNGNGNVYDYRGTDKRVLTEITNVTLESTEATIVEGSTFVLPTIATATLSDGTEKEVAVIWDVEVDGNKVGEQIFTGSIEGWDGALTFTLTVENKPVDKIKLNELLETIEYVALSEDGSDIEPTKQWTTEEAKLALQTEVELAQAIVAQEDVTQSEVDNAITSLEAAITTYKATQQFGVKTEEPEEEDIPLTPLEPATPVEPEEPEEEDIPLTPLEPATPVEPEEPEEEDIPLTPLEPATPVESEKEKEPLLPKTGQGSTAIFYSIGFVFLSSGLFLYRKKRIKI